MDRGKGGSHVAVHPDFADCPDIRRFDPRTGGRGEDHGPESGYPADPAETEIHPDHSVRTCYRVRTAVAQRMAEERWARRLQGLETHCSAAGKHSRVRKEKRTDRTARSNRHRRRTPTLRLLPPGADRFAPAPGPPGRRQSIGNNAQRAVDSSPRRRDRRRYAHRAPTEDISRRHVAHFRESSRPDRSIRRSASTGSAHGDCSSACRASVCFDLVSLAFPIVHLVVPVCFSARACERFTSLSAFWRCMPPAALDRIRRVSAVLLEDRVRYEFARPASINPPIRSASEIFCFSANAAIRLLRIARVQASYSVTPPRGGESTRLAIDRAEPQRI